MRPLRPVNNAPFQRANFGVCGGARFLNRRKTHGAPPMYPLLWDLQIACCAVSTRRRGGTFWHFLALPWKNLKHLYTSVNRPVSETPSGGRLYSSRPCGVGAAYEYDQQNPRFSCQKKKELGQIESGSLPPRRSSRVRVVTPKLASFSEIQPRCQVPIHVHFTLQCPFSAQLMHFQPPDPDWVRSAHFGFAAVKSLRQLRREELGIAGTLRPP